MPRSVPRAAPARHAPMRPAVSVRRRSRHGRPCPRGMDSSPEGIFFFLLKTLVDPTQHAGELRPRAEALRGWSPSVRWDAIRMRRASGETAMHVVVESPAKAKTVLGLLGTGHTVIATRGHVRDLPAKNGSVDPARGFALVYATSRRAASTLRSIAAALREADALVLTRGRGRPSSQVSGVTARGSSTARPTSRSTTTRTCSPSASTARSCWWTPGFPDPARREARGPRPRQTAFSPLI